MIQKERLFAPGPTALLPQAQAAMAAMHLHHRTAEFKKLFTATREALQRFLGTKNETLILASSGSGAMEAALANTISPGDAVVVFSAGKFGERWEQMAKAYGAALETVKLPYGESFTAEHASGKVTAKTAAIFLQATETSTGVRHDVEGLARAARKANPEVLVVVDGITGIGTSPLEVDAWELDFLIGGSQKAVMIQPGLAYLTVSERGWRAVEKGRSPRFYFDLRRERKPQAQGETACTPATGLVAALAAALEYIEARGGRAGLTANAELLARATRAGVEALGLTRFGHGVPAGALTAVESPAGLDSSEIVKALRKNFGSVVANGQGEMKGKMIRIAHLGYYDISDTLALLGQLELTLTQLGKLEKGRLGAGVRAAQSVWLEAAAGAGQQAAAS